MKWVAVILASGRGKRCKPLTDKVPKCLLEVNGKPMLEWTLDSIAHIPEISEIVITVDYLKHKIKKRFGRHHKGKKIKYIELKYVAKEKIKHMYENWLEYIEAELNSVKGKKFDYIARFNGDVVYDKKTAVMIAQRIRKNYSGFWGGLYAFYSKKLYDIYWELLKENKYKLLKITYQYYSLPFLKGKIDSKITIYDFYRKLLPNFTNKRFILDLERYLEKNKKKLMKKKAFLSKADLRVLGALGWYLHKNQHVDTPEDLEKLNKWFKGHSKTITPMSLSMCGPTMK